MTRRVMSGSVLGIQLLRKNTREGIDPLSEQAGIVWEKRSSSITDANGKVLFKQDDIEVPASWSQQATNIVANKYFRGVVGTPERETSVRGLILRVADTLTHWGRRRRYFASEADAAAFHDELCHLLVTQKVAFNSPVWFNVGVEATPQCSACFINSVDDTMESILGLARTEGMLFKYGSGAGSNLSPIRSSKELLAGGGTASGPVSFMRGFDAFAGVIKSGGKTRRAAKMVILNAEHPDILEFIDCKMSEEKKAWALIEAGYDGGFNVPGGAYDSVYFQNANHSVRVNDEFMKAVVDGKVFFTKAVKGGEKLEQLEARGVWRKMAEAAWLCGDPGVQFDTTINNWHTCKTTAPINASNPCCFVGETEVDTAEGRISFSELHRMEEGKLPPVFAFDLKTGMPVLRSVKKVWVAGKTKRLVEVRTQRGVVLRCTPEHRFLLQNGAYVEAQNLVPDTRLRKIARWSNASRRGQHCINHRVTTQAPNGTVWQSRFIWEQIHGPLPAGMQVHHKNEDPTDDRLSNLEILPVGTHQKHHAEGADNPRFISLPQRALVDVWEAIESAPRLTHKLKKGVTPARWNAYIAANNLDGIIPRASSARGGRIQGMPWSAFAASIDDARVEANDRVVSVTPIELDQEVEVFDMEVEGTHNFAVSSEGNVHSIVVHNSEYMFLDDSACNLASFNLMKFRNADGSFDVEGLRHGVQTVILAQEIIVDDSSYPSEKIARNSHDYRPLGLGYANLGALLMASGLPYDSDAGRAATAAVTALLGGEAYAASAEIAKAKGPFAGYAKNRDAMLGVMEMHRRAAYDVDAAGVPEKMRNVLDAARDAWSTACEVGRDAGFRNAQATVLAPTGTIGFMMDCDTTGIEPDIALIKYKKLVGGGLMKIVNGTVPLALDVLGYDAEQKKAILDYLESHETIEGAPFLKTEHLAVFDCAFKPQKGERSIEPMGHVRMMAAAQPFLSGAISKTVNMPESSTVEDIEHVYYEAWKLGLKAIAIYRDNCKRSQPLATSLKQSQSDGRKVESFTGSRRRLPPERNSITHKISISGHEGYLTVGLFEDGKPGEVFITMSKEGSTISGLMDAFATSISLALQYGVPLKVLVDKFSHMRFEPSGFTGNPHVPIAKSVCDYIFRWLGLKFLPADERPFDPTAAPLIPESQVMEIKSVARTQADAPSCPSCGDITVRSGSCYKCENCGSTTGCG